jgi:hypothetical protein
MKSLISSFFLLLITLFSFAQDKPLPFDERGKLIYYEVVESAKAPKDSLISRAKAFLKADAKKFKLSTVKGDTLIEAKGKILISKSALGLARPMGDLDYNFYVEVRDGRYRFWLTDFIFIPYMRDRYGNFVPSTTIGTPLEREQSKLRSAEWQSYQKIAAREAKSLGEQFKVALATTVSPAGIPKPKSTISTKKW